eukprot:Skav204811  [mRNA]  locus=scaffold894:134749:140530:+ [translate_table: standard]
MYSCMRQLLDGSDAEAVALVDHWDYRMPVMSRGADKIALAIDLSFPAATVGTPAFLPGKSSVAEIRSLLEGKADPNCRLRRDRGLLVPCMTDSGERTGADVGSQYSRKLGLSDSDYHGPAVCAACASGNVDVLKLHGSTVLLVQYDAPLSGRLGLLNQQPNSTLLYEASYFGHAEMVQYLLQQKSDHNVEVTCHWAAVPEPI